MLFSTTFFLRVLSEHQGELAQATRLIRQETIVEVRTRIQRANKLANQLACQNERWEATRVLRTALAMQRRVLAFEIQRTFNALNNLVGVLTGQGELTEALWIRQEMHLEDPMRGETQSTTYRSYGAAPTPASDPGSAPARARGYEAFFARIVKRCVFCICTGDIDRIDNI